jgi:glycosyltransferase involved in cell wall biosynthesis
MTGCDNMKPIISIVVPIYKVEDYIDKCINSLINQTYKNIEIILVDDGSPDRCPEICDNYAKEDNRIKVFHKKNGGLSDARNAGLKLAEGKYILFVDSDDYIELDTCKRFIDIIGNNKPDIVVGNARRIENGSIKAMQHKFITHTKVVTGMQYLKEELKSGSMYMVAWLNLYNKEYMLRNGLEFRVGLLHEDEEFTPRAFLKAEKVIGSDFIFYNYLIRDGSITTTEKKIKNAEHMIKTCKELENIYSKVEDDELRRLLNNNLVDKYLNIFQISGLHKKEFKSLVDKRFLKNKAYTKRNKFRVALFMVSKKLYYYVNKSIKKMRLRT